MKNMIQGSEKVQEYSTVYARSIDTYDSQQASGNDGDMTLVGGYTFTWEYDPNGQSGFTGVSWFEGVSGSPLQATGYSVEEVETNLKNGTWTNLNVIFEAWQDYVEENSSVHVASDFAKYLTNNNAAGCWY